MLSIWKKHSVLIPDYIRLALRREAEYKVGFYTFILNQLISISLWLLFWNVLMSKIGSFGKWNYEHVIVLTGFVAFNAGLWLTFLFIWRMPVEILTGALNAHLIKPVHPFLHLIFRRLNLRSFPRMLMGIAIVAYALFHYGLPHDFGSVTLATATSLLSFLAVFMPLAMIGLTAFWIGRAEFLRDLFVELFIFQNYPLTEFPRAFIMFFMFVIPLIFSGTMPVVILTKNFGQWSGYIQSLLIFAALLIIVTVQLLAFNWIWRAGLRRYESYGG